MLTDGQRRRVYDALPKRKTEANTISGSVGSERNTAQTHQSIYPET